MDLELPKRIFGEGTEPEVEKVNNCCKMTLMTMLSEAMPDEYNVVKSDPVFAHILRIKENGLGFSGRLVHSFMCRQLATAKVHELWFVFGRRPLRFSMQEFHAVTGLKCVEDGNCDFDKWVDDDGFWSKLLKRRGKINIQMIRNKHIKEANKWTRVDRLRLVFLCVIAGLLMVKDEKVFISHTYIKLVMDFEKLRSFPWGIHSYDHLVSSIVKARVKLIQPTTYALEGFLYAFQIWIMEAIPDLGVLVGKKINEDVIVNPRCSNWKGAARISYAEINQLEHCLESDGVLHPYISSTGNFDVFDCADFLRDDEMKDERVDYLNDLIRGKNEWSRHIWQVEEAVKNYLQTSDEEIKDVVDDFRTPTAEGKLASGSVLGKKKLPDYGAETCKKKLLCQRSAAKP